MKKSNWKIYTAEDYKPCYRDSNTPKYSHEMSISHGPEPETLTIGFSPAQIRLDLNPATEGVIYLELSDSAKKIIMNESYDKCEKPNFKTLIDKINGELLISL